MASIMASKGVSMWRDPGDLSDEADDAWREHEQGALPLLPDTVSPVSSSSPPQPSGGIGQQHDEEFEIEDSDVESEPSDDGDDDYEHEESESSDADGWSSDDEAEYMASLLAEDAPREISARSTYLYKCHELGLPPVAMFMAKIESEVVNLHHRGMGSKGAMAISEALRVNTSIRSLNLSDNWLEDAGATHIARVLPANRTLVSLHLGDNRIGHEGARAVCAALADSPLCELSLRGNGLDDRAAEPLCDAIRRSTSLAKLDVSYNRLSTRAGKLLGEVLGENAHTLLNLDLSWNTLRPAGGAALMMGLCANTCLSHLSLNWNGLQEPAAGAPQPENAGRFRRALISMLELNRALTKLEISHNRIDYPDTLPRPSGMKLVCVD